MPFNGSGTFILVAGNPVVTGAVISSTVQNNTMNDFASALTSCITRDGQSAALANLPMGGFKHTGAAPGSNSGDYLTYGQSSASLASASVGTLSVTGNANINGNVTVGDAVTDTLTINPNAVSWPGNPTHSGDHLFSGRVLASGNGAFHAVRGGSSNQTSGTAVIFGTELFDRGNVYNTATGVFTAPVAGVYTLMSKVNIANGSGGGQTGTLAMIASVKGLISTHPISLAAAGTIATTLCCVISLAASETVFIGLDGSVPFSPTGLFVKNDFSLSNNNFSGALLS